MERNILFTRKMIEEEAKEYMKGAKKFPTKSKPRDTIQKNRKYNFKFFIIMFLGNNILVLLY